MKYLQFFLRNLPSLLLYSLLFLLFITHPADLDLGWHLKYGEYVWQHHQVLRTNTFSTTMPGYLWINSTTGTDVLSYILYRFGGFQAISISGALLSLSALYLFSKASRLGYIQQLLIYPILVYVTQPYWLISLRGQLISIAVLGLLSLLLRNAERKPKVLLSIPLLFLVWANIHGQVVIGLILLFLWTVSQFLTRSRTLDKQSAIHVLVPVSSFLACGINPYGFAVFTEFGKYIGNPIMAHIGEWVPFEPFSLYWWQFMAIAAITIIAIFVIVLRQKTKQYFGWIIISLLFLALTLLQRRYGIMFYFFSLPLVAEILPISLPVFNRHAKKLTVLAQLVALVFILMLAGRRLNELKTMSWYSYCTTLQCPTEAAQFLRAKAWNKPILTYYDWGGWLIWNYPDIPPNIDGRMPLWKNANGISPYTQYSSYITNLEDIDSSPYNTVFIPHNIPIYNRLLDLEELGKWKTIYEDTIATIFVRVQK